MSGRNFGRRKGEGGNPILWLAAVMLLPWFGEHAKIFAVTEKVVIPSDRLEFFVVDINGKPQKVKNGDELVVVTGDVIEVKEAVLRDPNRKVESVNLVGFQSLQATRKGEDRGFAVRTDRDLLKHWSIGKRGDLYKISATSGLNTHGEAYLRLIAPKIKFAELTVNGKKRLIREGELLRLKKTDQISINDVRTNIEDDREKVDFQIVTIDDLALPGVKLFEIKFSRAGSIFARIPMQVEGYEEHPEK